jgi:vacuolar-type H+-ATPase subunit I/STV1
MEINKLRSIIKEAVMLNLKEIEEAAENAAMEAKRRSLYDKAIKNVKAKIETAENLEEIKDLMDEGKINELKKHLKSLQKSKEKLEKAKAKKNKGKEVVTDEPVEDTVDEGNYYDEAESDDAAHIDALEKDMEDDAMNNEVALNESFLKMQKLAGVITHLTENQVEEGAVIDKMQKLAGVITESNQYNEKKK